MASRARSIRNQELLWKAMELRAQNLGIEGGVSEYLRSLAWYDMTIQGEHTLTRAWLEKSPAEQEQINRGIMALTKRGVGVRGQWLKHALKEVEGDLSRVVEQLIADGAAAAAAAEGTGAEAE